MRKRSEVGTVVREQAEDHESPVPSRQVMEAVARDRDPGPQSPPLPTPDASLKTLVATSYKPKQTSAVLELDGTTTVTLAWAEEKFSPIPGSFSSCSVGPFGLTFSVAHGQNIAAAMDRGMRVLAEYAEVERERKVRNFVNNLRQVVGEAKGQ